MNSKDVKNLDLLSTFHYVYGGIVALLSCLPLIHLTIGIFLFFDVVPEASGDSFPAGAVGMLFIAVSLLLVFSGWIAAVLIIIAGRKIKTRKNRLFCIVVAAIECLQAPLGTILGVFTIIALCKDSTAALFDQEEDCPVLDSVEDEQ